MPTASLEAVEPVGLRIPEPWRTDSGKVRGRPGRQALQREVELTPKPGLVDRLNSGSHRDMDLATFHASIQAIAPWFPSSTAGRVHAGCGCRETAAHLRPAGRACEDAMLQATAGVNTHKGSIFCMGLLSAALGRLDDGEDLPDAERLCAEVARICSSLVETELLRIRSPERLERDYFKLMV